MFSVPLDIGEEEFDCTLDLCLRISSQIPLSADLCNTCCTVTQILNFINLILLLPQTRVFVPPFRSLP